MAEIDIEKMAKICADAVLDSYEYQGKTIREWINIIADQDQKFGKWIPVSEELPKENEAVIASTKYGVYPEARYIKEYGWEWAYEAGADYWKELENVTAWMPLPKTYNPQEREELEDLSKRVENIEKQMIEDREERLKKLQADLDYAKFCCALPTIQRMMGGEE